MFDNMVHVHHNGQTAKLTSFFPPTSFKDRSILRLDTLIEPSAFSYEAFLNEREKNKGIKKVRKGELLL